MKKELIRAVADAIEAAPERFTMATYLSDNEEELVPSPGCLAPDCGTAGCIAGWTISMFGNTEHDPFEKDEPYILPWAWAAAILGISRPQAWELFCPDGVVTAFWAGISDDLEYDEILPRSTFHVGDVVDTLRGIADGTIEIFPIMAEV